MRMSPCGGSEEMARPRVGRGKPLTSDTGLPFAENVSNVSPRRLTFSRSAKLLWKRPAAHIKAHDRFRRSTQVNSQHLASKHNIEEAWNC